MKQRCYGLYDKDYRFYGGRGIKICDEWINNPKSFEIWALSHGYDDDLTIDRTDGTMDYSPENCRWINALDNAKWQYTALLINVDGEVYTCRDWGKRLGISGSTIKAYVKKHGLNNTIEFIRRRRSNPMLMRSSRQGYYYDYMNDNTILTLQDM